MYASKSPKTSFKKELQKYQKRASKFIKLKKRFKGFKIKKKSFKIKEKRASFVSKEAIIQVRFNIISLFQKGKVTSYNYISNIRFFNKLFYNIDSDSKTIFVVKKILSLKTKHRSYLIY